MRPRDAPLPAAKRSMSRRAAVEEAAFPPTVQIFRASFDFNVHIRNGVDQTLLAGQQVWAQYWTRDGGMPSGTGLTNGLTFTICQ